MIRVETKLLRCGLFAGLSAALALTACAPNVPLKRAPVVDRSSSERASTGQKQAQRTSPGMLGGLFGSSAVPTTVAVKRGDTVFSIAREYGIDWRDIVSLNQLSNPNQLMVGQVLKLPPTGTTGSAGVSNGEPVASAQPVVPPAPLEMKPGAPLPPLNPATSGVNGAATPPNAVTPSGPGHEPAYVPPAGSNAQPAAPQDAPPKGLSASTWSWPLANLSQTSIQEPFVEGKSKGVVLMAPLGAEIRAAGDGRVVYAGNALKGYGNLVIIKHDQEYLSAYGNTRNFSVKQGDNVKQGQKIAELGRGEGDKPGLILELRKAGKPLDPVKILPALR